MKRVFKILLKTVLALFILFVATFGLLYFMYNEPQPQGIEGPEAEALAQKMLKAIHYEAYTGTRYLEWSYAGGKHRYIWDKENGKVQVLWAAYKVHLDLAKPLSSDVFEDDVKILNASRTEIIKTATDYFNNDSFWLVAPFKIYDQGTSRTMVTLDNGSKGLLVTYSSGGTTPGDSYLWILNENGFPQSYRMWVKIIPIGGIEATWDDWKIMESGAFLPTSHQLGPVTLSMGKVKAYN